MLNPKTPEMTPHLTSSPSKPYADINPSVAFSAAGATTAAATLKPLGITAR